MAERISCTLFSVLRIPWNLDKVHNTVAPLQISQRGVECGRLGMQNRAWRLQYAEAHSVRL